MYRIGAQLLLEGNLKGGLEEKHIEIPIDHALLLTYGGKFTDNTFQFDFLNYLFICNS